MDQRVALDFRGISKNDIFIIEPHFITLECSASDGALIKGGTDNVLRMYYYRQTYQVYLRRRINPSCKFPHKKLKYPAIPLYTTGGASNLHGFCGLWSAELGVGGGV